MIKLQNIEKNFKGFSLNIDSLSISESNYYVLLGPTGSGKTLLLSIIGGLIQPDNGSVLISNKDITKKEPEKRGFGIVYQDSALFPHLDVVQNIAFGLRLKKYKKDFIKGEVKTIMERLGILYLYGRTIRGLSGGEMQRIALARALIMKPSILLFDEPFSSLDYLTKEEMLKLVKQIRKEFNPTVIHITHDFEEAMVLADKVGVIKRGSIIQSGTVNDIFRHPKDPFVANFVGARNIFKGTISGEKNETIFKTIDGIDLFIGREIQNEVSNAMIRADEIILTRNPTRSSATNTFKGTVSDIIHRRGVVEVHVDTGTVINVFITTRSLSDMDIKRGDSIFMVFKGSAIHLF